jgi:hypothetical protein
LSDKPLNGDRQAIDRAEAMLDGSEHQITNVLAADAAGGGEEAHGLAVTAIEREGDPACEQISSSMSATSMSVVGRHCKVLGISPGQMRHAEPSLSSTSWLLSCLLICIADLPCN